MKTNILIVFLLGLFLTACGASSSPTPAVSVPPVQPADVKISIANFTFDPATITIPAGSTITWTNNDSVSHDVTADDGSWGSKSLAPGDTFSQIFTKAGTFPYHCGFHSSMKATVTVVSP